MRYRTTVVAALAAGGLVLGGCAPSEGGAGVPATTTALAGAPTAFDPCTDIPQSVLDSEELRSKVKNDNNGADGLQWRGCVWSQVDGYSTSIETTNLTLDMVRDERFADSTETTIGGRRTISYRPDQQRPAEECSLNVEIEGGSLEVGVTNPSSRKRTGHLDTCELARTLTEKVVAVLPADA